MNSYFSYPLAALALIATTAHAGGGLEGYGVPSNMSFYAGVNTGVAQQAGACDAAPNGKECDKTDKGYQMYGGLRLEPMTRQPNVPSLGIEAGYIDFGKSTAQGEILSSRGIAIGDAKAQSELTSVYAAGVGYLPITPRTELMGKAGLAYWQQKGEVTVADDPTLNTASKKNGLSAILGGGAQYKVSDNLALRGEYERILDTAKDTNYQADADLYSIGAVFSTY